MTGKSTAYGYRERVGLARWLQDLTGFTTLWAGEDARSPDTGPIDSTVPYWGLSKGKELRREQREYLASLTTSVVIDFVPTLGVERYYQIDIGYTPVIVLVESDTEASELSGLVIAAWDKAGLALSSREDGTGSDAIVLTPVDGFDARFTVTRAATAGGVPQLDVSGGGSDGGVVGWALVSAVQTPERWLVQWVLVTRTVFCTCRAGGRAAGAADQACGLVERSQFWATRTDDETYGATVRLSDYTGGVVERATVIPLDEAAASPSVYNPQGVRNVAQLEIVIVGEEIHARPDPSIALNTEYDDGSSVQLDTTTFPGE